MHGQNNESLFSCVIKKFYFFGGAPDALITFLNELYTHDCNLEQRNDNEETMLIQLLERNIDKKCVNKDGVMTAEDKEKVFYPIIKWLLEHGANCNAADKYGDTPLIWICEDRKYREDKLISLLLEQNTINVLAKNKLGQNAIDISLEKGNFLIVDLLLKHLPTDGQAMTSPEYALYYALKEGKQNLCSDLELDVDIFNYVVWKGYNNIANTFLEKKHLVPDRHSSIRPIPMHVCIDVTLT